MIKLIHDTTNTMFRDPAGACPAGSSVTLTLQISKDMLHYLPALHVQFDKDNSVETIQMEPSESCAGDLFNSWKAAFTPSAPGLYWYWFTLSNEYEGSGYDGSGAEQNTIRVGRDPVCGQAVMTDQPLSWQITAYRPAYEDVDWIRGGVFYHIFVDRFAKSGPPAFMSGKITRSDWGGMPQWWPDKHGEILNNDFFGGNLAGIREKLPYLEELGVTCLYLSPIFEAYSNHKYDTSDFMRVDPMFGDEKEFTCLCREAADRGIRVICDGVFSHTGSDSRYFDVLDLWGNGACHHPDSPYREWYYFEEDGWQSWWGIKTLPRVNKDVPSYQEFIMGEDGVIRHWLRAGASGWRLDVVDELPRSFLEKLTAAAKAEKSDALVLGEVWEDASNKVAYDERKNYFEGDKLDSVMNYPLRTGIINYVRDGDAGALAAPLRMMLENYPDRVIHALMNILGTHDTERIITALAGQRLGPHATRDEKAQVRMDEGQWAIGIRRLKIAVCLQMTLPGVPCIYYGDEAGMEGYNDPFNRCCYPWGHENQELQDWYRRVIAIRRSSAVYTDGSCRLLAARDGLFAFERAGSVETGSVESEAAETGSAVSAAIAGVGVDASAQTVPARHVERRITVTNCGQTQQVLPLLGRWRDLLSGAEFTDDIFVVPGQAMILAEICS